MDAGQIVSLVLVSVGGSGAIIAALSSWLGKIWADRLAETEKARHSKELEQLKLELDKVRAQDLFISELYVEGIREYSSEQARQLRQAYLFLFEPRSSTADAAGKDPDERVEMAVREVMQPLRQHLGLLDESTMSKMYSIQNELLKLKDRTPDEWKREKNELFNEIELARQFVKADKIAFRLGLISRSLEERK